MPSPQPFLDMLHRELVLPVLRRCFWLLGYSRVEFVEEHSGEID